MLPLVQDQSRLRCGQAAQSFTVLRHLALSLLRQEITCPNGIKVKRLKAAWDNEYLTRVLFSPKSTDKETKNAVSSSNDGPSAMLAFHPLGERGDCRKSA
jgi:hypothetical protein